MSFDMTRRFFLTAMATVMVMPNKIFASDSVHPVSIPILLYHDLSSKWWLMKDDYTVTPALFAAQMEWLHSNGYKAVSFADLGKESSLEKAVIITFDDGYASFVHYAFPFLRSYGFKATINIIGQYVGSYITDQGARPTLSWDEYRYLKSSGLVSLGCHTDRYMLSGIKERQAFPMMSSLKTCNGSRVFSNRKWEPPRKLSPGPMAYITKEVLPLQGRLAFATS